MKTANCQEPLFNFDVGSLNNTITGPSIIKLRGAVNKADCSQLDCSISDDFKSNLPNF